MISVHTAWKCRRWGGGHLFSKPEAWKPLEAINTVWVIHKFLRHGEHQELTGR